MRKCLSFVRIVFLLSWCAAGPVVVIVVDAFSIPNTNNNNNNLPHQKNGPEVTTTSDNNERYYLPFSTFQFAPNGVCISPQYFVVEEKNDRTDSSSSNSNNIRITHPQHKRLQKQQYFTMRNVPGEGDCMFLAIALATFASMGLGGNDTLLRKISQEIRSIVATVFESGGNDKTLIIDDIRGTISVSKLLQYAASTEQMSPSEYIRRLRLDGKDGGLYGGGPELTVLTNLLRRPISIYHLISNDNNNGDKKNSKNKNDDMQPQQQTIQRIKCMGIFGADSFSDPLLRFMEDDNAKQSAILSPESPSLYAYGAYSWHIHILVVDSSPTEKHACVLLPQQLDQQ